jgi:hypothetical protein
MPMHRLPAILLAAMPAAAQLPEFYRTVDRVVRVAGGVVRVTERRKKAGLLRVWKRANAAVELSGSRAVKHLKELNE